MKVDEYAELMIAEPQVRQKLCFVNGHEFRDRFYLDYDGRIYQ